MFLKLELVAAIFATVLIVGCAERPSAKFRAQKGLLKFVKGDSECVRDIEFSPDGKWIFTAGLDGLKQWDAKSLRLVDQSPVVEGKYNVHQIYSIAVSPLEPIVYVGGIVKDVQVWNYETKKLVATIPTRDRWSTWLTALAINPQGSILVIAENGGNVERKHFETSEQEDFTILVWDLRESKEIKRLIGHGKCCVSLKFSPDGQKLRSRLNNCVVYWNMNDYSIHSHVGDLKPERDAGIESSPQNGFDVSLINNIVAPVSKLDLNDGFTRTNNQLSDGTGFMPARGLSMSANWNGKISFTDLATGELVKIFEQFDTGMKVECVAISPDGKMAVSGGDGESKRGGFGYNIDQSNRNLCFWKLE